MKFRIRQYFPGLCFLLTAHLSFSNISQISSDAWRHTSNGFAYDPQRLECQACRESCGSERREGPSHDHRESTRSSAPEGYGRRQEYNSRLHSHSSGARGRLYEGPSSASSESSCKRACKPLVFVGNFLAQASSTYHSKND